MQWNKVYDYAGLSSGPVFLFSSVFLDDGLQLDHWATKQCSNNVNNYIARQADKYVKLV